MVTIISYELRQNTENEDFVALILQGDLVMVQSSGTGRFYATAKRCSITSTFTEEQAKALVGRAIPGKVVRVPCEEYEYVVPETAESITLSHRWEYSPEGEPTPLRVAHSNIAA